MRYPDLPLNWRLSCRLFVLAAALALSADPAPAVIIAGGDGTGNDTSTGAGGGWGYVGSVNGASGVYLGNYGGSYWVLTAAHVGAGSFLLNSTSYSLVAGSGQQIGGVDLYVFEISVPEGDTNLGSLANLSLSSTAPSTGSSVTMIGYGRNRATDMTTWYVDTTPPTWVWSETAFPPDSDSSVSGYKWTSGNTKRWGANTMDSTTTVSGTSMLVADFDAIVGQSQVATGDSGGGMFYLNGSTWELAGILDLRGTYNNQPADTAVFGNASYAIDISQYRSQILTAVVPEPDAATLVGLGILVVAATRRCKGSRRLG